MEALGPIISLFNTLVIHPLINMLVAVYDVLMILNIPYAAGFSIIGLTILIRVLFYPLTNKQLQASRKMQEVAPLIAEIKEKYKGDSRRIQEEQMKLYREKGINPAAGCLPTLIQLPILLGLYQVLNNMVHVSPGETVEYINNIVIKPLQISAPWDLTFFGIPLGQSPQQMIGTFTVVAIAVPVVTGIFQFIQSKMMFSTPPAPKNKKTKNDDFATVFQKQAAYIFPVMIAFFSFNFPFGLSLYWNTFSIFGIIQQYKVSGLGGLEHTWQKIKETQKKK